MKVIRVESCLQCPYSEIPGRFEEILVCRAPSMPPDIYIVANLAIDEDPEIPTWCPLESDEINRRAEEVDQTEWGFDCFGSKIIPYIGWFWRNVDWDAEECLLGVVPGEPPLVGFMQNNKWSYPSFTIEGESWATLRLLVEALLKDTPPSAARCAELCQFMQSLCPPWLSTWSLKDD